MNLLKDSALILAIITATLYCAGTASFYAILTTLKIDPYIIERNFHQIIYSGAIVIYNAFFSKYEIYFTIGFAIFIFLFLFFLHNKKLLPFYYPTLNPTNNIKEKSTTNSPLNIIFVGISIFVFLGLIISLSQEKGTATAKTFLNDVKKGDGKLNNITVNHLGKETQLIKILCGINKCAALEKKTMKVYFLKNDEIIYTSIY